MGLPDGRCQWCGAQWRVMTAELSWSRFQDERPGLAEAGRGLLYQFGVGLGFLSTVRRDGGPRLHPICPVLAEGRLLAHIIPSAKRDDLHRDGRYALHSFPVEGNEDAFYLTGHAVAVADAELARAAAQTDLLTNPGLESAGRHAHRL
jgi:hypothetical protein